MKMSSVIFLLAFITTNCFAKTCKDYYQDSKWRQINFSGEAITAIMGTGAGGFIVGGFISVLTLPASQLGAGFALSAFAGPVAILTGMGATATTIAVHNHKPNKMIKLIDQAELYANVGGVPGKELRNFWLGTNKQYTLEELSEFITNGNNDLSLCSTDLVSYRMLKKMIKNGEVIILNEQTNNNSPN